MPSSPSTKKSTPKAPKDRAPKQVRYGSSWKSPLHDLELPSGEICQVKRPGVQGLMKAGVLESMDSLTAIVQQETIPTAEGKPLPKKEQIESVVNDPEKFKSMMETTDKIVLHVVTQPKLRTEKVTTADIANKHVLTELTDEDLDRDLTDEEKVELKEFWDSDNANPLVFIDWIDTIDKMFIMNFAVGGSADLVKFREATESALGGLSAL